MPLLMLIGGARSGKSSLALVLAGAQGEPVVFVATATAGDADMAARIARHRDERPQEWETIEEPIDLAGALAAASAQACVVVDCLTLWVANLMEAGLDAPEVALRSAEAARIAAARPGWTIAVSNEVGLGVVPATPLGREYRDLLGRVNAAWAAVADDMLLVVAGRTLRLGPAPASLDALS